MTAPAPTTAPAGSSYAPPRPPSPAPKPPPIVYKPPAGSPPGSPTSKPKPSSALPITGLGLDQVANAAGISLPDADQRWGQLLRHLHDAQLLAASRPSRQH
ncbi:MAG: hypothetical protein ACYCUG_01630 [Acidimicrobiales bacterium]